MLDGIPTSDKNAFVACFNIYGTGILCSVKECLEDEISSKFAWQLVNLFKIKNSRCPTVFVACKM